MAHAAGHKIDIDDFFNIVERMRKMQKEYFRNREQATLMISKDLERRVDSAIQVWRDPSLF